jgi:uncharacterized caspase-like protein
MPLPYAEADSELSSALGARGASAARAASRLRTEGRPKRAQSLARRPRRARLLSRAPTAVVSALPILGDSAARPTRHIGSLSGGSRPTPE